VSKKVIMVTVDGTPSNSKNKFNHLNKILKWCYSQKKTDQVIHFSNFTDGFYDDEIIKFREIPNLNLNEYNIFCINELPKLLEDIDYTHMLMVQSDGFVLNGELWLDEFLEYDYIGAPWVDENGPIDWTSMFGQSSVVGNGGFCIRSKKLMTECKTLLYDVGINEDGLICLRYRKYLESRGIKFANEDLAFKFSVETPSHKANINESFGFHGKHFLEFANRIVGEL